MEPLVITVAASLPPPGPPATPAPPAPPPPPRPRSRRGRRAAAFLAGLAGAFALAGLGPPERGPDVQKPAKPAAAPGKPPEPPWVPAQAVLAAAADHATLSPFDRPFVRYLWLPDADVDWARATSFAANLVSRSPSPFLPPPVAGGHLLKLDLRWLARDEADLRDYLRLWEDFRYDPMFALLVTKDNLDLAAQLCPDVLKRTVKVKVSKVVHDRPRPRRLSGPVREEIIFVHHPGGDYVYPDGSGTVKDMPPGRYEVHLHWHDAAGPDEPAREHTEIVEEDVCLADALKGGKLAVLRLNPGHIDPKVYCALQDASGSLAPVVDARYFTYRALDQVRDAQESAVYDTVWGGRYYALRGVRKSEEKGVTDQQLFFSDFLGINVQDAACNARDLFQRLRSDQRALRFRSGVTGKPRVSAFVAYAGARFERSGGSWTLDPKDADVDAKQRAFANLFDPFFRASEGIFPGANGLPVCVLFNDKGELQDEVPPDVAHDTTIPPPYTQRLRPWISCGRCHKGDDFWKPHPNDVKLLTGGRLGLDAFGDLGAGRGAFSPDTVGRLAGLYAGDLDFGLRRARDDFAEAALRVVGVRPGAGGQEDAGRWACGKVEEGVRRYWYTPVTRRQALLELGVRGAGGDADRAAFDALVPPDPRAAAGYAFVAEDPRVGAVRAGLELARSDWGLAYALVAERALKTRLERGAPK